MPPAATPARNAPLDRPLVAALVVIAACVAMYWVGIGTAGFSSTEGHRALPAWEMLDSGDWWLPRLFGRVYLRKPPGMPWAIAAASSLLGRTEFAARSVSALAATASAVLALVFARRWFGPRAGLAAGLSQAVMPVWITFARGAEIEPLHTLACQATVFLIIDLGRAGRGSTPLRAALLALAISAAGLVKGPAGVPVLVGTLVGAALAARSWRAALRPAVLAGCAAGALVLTGAYLTLRARLLASGETPVLQDPSEFAPSLARASKILRLAPAAVIQGLPVTSAVIVALWPKRDPGERDRAAGFGAPDDARTTAESLAWSFVCSLAALMLCGVSNPRYALPALAPLAPLAGWCWVGRLGLFEGLQRRIVTRAALYSIWSWPVIGMLLGSVYTFVFFEPRRAAIGGDQAGGRIAEVLPDGSVVYADWLVEARPDVLEYARAAAERAGKHVRVRWVDLEHWSPDPAEHAVLAVRTDQQGNELARPGIAEIVRGWRPLHQGVVYKYSFEILEHTAEADSQYREKHEHPEVRE